jgi:hypothetical protein
MAKSKKIMQPEITTPPVEPIAPPEDLKGPKESPMPPKKDKPVETTADDEGKKSKQEENGWIGKHKMTTDSQAL